MWSLIRKEWRESRALVLGLVLLAPLAMLACREFLTSWDPIDVGDSSPWVISALLLAAVLALSADLFAADASSGRIGFFAALPVRPATIWLSKVLFFLIVSSVYLTYLVGLEAALFSAVGLNPWLLFRDAPWYRAGACLTQGYQLAVVLAVAGGMLFFGVLIHRGFAAVIAALATVGGLVLLYRGIDIEARSHDHVLRTFAAGLIAAAFVTGSFVAFTWGRLHLGAPVRRTALGVAALLLVLVPAVGWAGASVVSFQNAAPSDSDLTYEVCMPHEGGDWAVVWATRERKSRLFNLRRPVGLWALNTADGRVRRLRQFADDHREYPAVFPAGEGRLDICNQRVVQTVDIESGRGIGQRAVSRETAAELGMRYRRLPRHCSDGSYGYYYHGPTVFETPPEWHIRLTLDENSGLFCRFEGRRPSSTFAVFLAKAGRFVPLAPLPRYWRWLAGLMPRDQDGAALLLSRGWDQDRYRCRVERVPLDGSPRSEEFAGRYYGLEISPDQRKILLLAEGGPFLLRASDASVRRIAVPETRNGRALWDWDSEHLVLLADDGQWHVTLAEGRERVRPLHLPPLEGNILHLTGDRFLHQVGGRDGQVLEAVGLDGSVRRLLPTEE